MKVPEAKIFIKALIERQVPLTPCLVGSMGIGKSMICAQVAEELGIGLIDLRLAQMEVGDLIGIPYLKGNKTFWGQPGWWPEERTRGILLLDEINRSATDVRQSIFQLILADHKGQRKLHTHILPKGWAVVAAMNPDNGEYQTEQLDKAMIRRFIMLAVQPDIESWLLWAKQNVAIAEKEKPNVDQAVTSFIATNQNLLNLTENFDIEVKPSSDAWTMLSRLMEANVIPHEVEFEIMSGIVGKEAAVAFQKWLDANYARPVSGIEILNKYNEIVKKLHKQRNDEWYATKLDLLTYLVNNKDLNEMQLNNLHSFIKDSPADIRAAFIQGLPSELLKKLSKKKDFLIIVSKSLQKAEEEEEESINKNEN